MKTIGQDIYVPVEGLVELGVSENTLKSAFQRNSLRWQAIPDPADGRRRLVRYDTLADKYKAALKATLWGGFEPAEWLAMEAAKGDKREAGELAQLLHEACETLYMKWMLDYAPVVKQTDCKRLRERQQRCLARAAAVLEAIGKYYQNSGLAWRDNGPVKTAANWLKDEQGRYFPLKYVPMNPIVLKDKLVQVWLDGKEYTDVITLPRAGNDSRALHQEDSDVRAWCIQARMSGRNLAVAEIARRVRRACELTEKAMPSASWIQQLLAQPAIVRMTATSRWGVGSGRGDFYKGYIPTTRALYAGDCWQMDATRVNILPHTAPPAPSGGAKKSGKLQFLVVCVARDVYSGDILGVSFGVSENRWMYLDALKMAVKTAGYLPYELVHDKFPGHNTEEIETTWQLLAKLGVKRTVTAVATGKAQTERWFGTLQSVFLGREKYYYGEGIRSTRAYAHRSPEYLAKLRKEANEAGFDFDAAWQMAWRAICGYRHTLVSAYNKRKIDNTPAELHEMCEKPHVKNLELWETATLFWNQSTLKIRRNAVTLTVRKQEYMYAITDTRILNNFSELRIRYDESDLGTVLAFYPNSEVLIGELKLQQAINIYGPDADWSGFQKVKTANREYVLAQKEALRVELEGSRDLEGVLGEDTLLLGARVGKADIEGAETALLYEQMAVVSEALRGVVSSSAAVAPLPPAQAKVAKTDEAEIDIMAHIRSQW